jgi:septal ring factor EnvC (AmiA/AmiB activator)
LLVGATALVVGAMLPWAGAWAQSIGELESNIESARAEADSLGAEIEANTAAIASAQAEAEAAAAREAEMTAVLEQGEAKLALLQEQVDLNQAALERARRQLERALEVLGNRLVAIYKGDTPDTTTLLLDSEGFDDLVTRIDYLEALQNADDALVERVRALRAQIQAQLVLVENARDQQADFNERIETARNEITSVRVAAEERASELAALRFEQVSAMESLRANIDDWAAEVAELEEVSASEAETEVAGWFGDYAIPTAIVMCESGGNYGAVNPSSGAGGAYQIIPSTWELYGGEGAPQDASPAEQDAIAAQIWADSGPAAWVCAG